MKEEGVTILVPYGLIYFVAHDFTFSTYTRLLKPRNQKKAAKRCFAAFLTLTFA